VQLTIRQGLDFWTLGDKGVIIAHLTKDNPSINLDMRKLSQLSKLIVQQGLDRGNITQDKP
jgi:hypothetical protein